MFDTWLASFNATEKSVTHPDNQMRKETYQLGIFKKKKKGIGTESKILFLFYEIGFVNYFLGFFGFLFFIGFLFYVCCGG